MQEYSRGWRDGFFHGVLAVAVALAIWEYLN